MNIYMGPELFPFLFTKKKDMHGPLITQTDTWAFKPFYHTHIHAPFFNLLVIKTYSQAFNCLFTKILAEEYFFSPCENIMSITITAIMKYQ